MQFDHTAVLHNLVTALLIIKLYFKNFFFLALWNTKTYLTLTKSLSLHMFKY